MTDAKAAEGNLAKEEPGSPAASGESAGDVAEAAPEDAGVLDGGPMRQALGMLFFQRGGHFVIG
jgi:hypothetical protein